MNTTKFIFIGFTAFLIGSCQSNESDSKEEEMEKYTINTDYMDTTVSPKQDFFQYADGTWVKNNPVPPSESTWGSFNELDKANKKKLTKILDESSKNKGDKGSDAQLIGSFYDAMKNWDQRNEEGLSKLKTLLEEVQEIDDLSALPRFYKEMKKRGASPFVSFYISQDMKNVDTHIPNISQGGLGLPNRDYYTDESKKDIRKAYTDYMTKTFDYVGYDNAASIATSILDLETKMAEKMMKPAELRFPDSTYNPISVEDVKKYNNIIDVQAYIETFDGNDIDSVVIGQPEYLNSLSETLQSVPLQTVKNYLSWKYINHYAPYLNQDMEKLHFNFYGTELSGTKEMKPMNEKAIEKMTSLAVKTALAKEFVARHFSEDAKDKVNQMVDNLLAVYEGRLKNLDWMTADTKKEALKKLHAIGRKLGYPDEWKNLDELKITSSSYVDNIDACIAFSYNKNMNKMHEPVDEDEWGMPAHMVNAYYHPLFNEIAFPAGIMQAPFFDINAEDAINYGAIGMVIGHEFTHGFDDMGSKFGADGSFSNWWSKEDRKNFEERTKKLGNTYAKFCPFDGVCVNPQLTMGENIADLGGITMSYNAYTKTDEFKNGEKRKGFTPAQRFFIGYAQLWKINYTDEALKKRIATDPHSPGMFRVNGPLMNFPAFFEAFDVQENDPMRNAADSISKIW